MLHYKRETLKMISKTQDIHFNQNMAFGVESTEFENIHASYYYF